MKKFLFIIVALSMFTTYGQGVMVVSEVETEDMTSFKSVMNQWMGAVKKTMEMDNARVRTFQEAGSRKLQIVQWFGSMSEMAKYLEDTDAKRSEIMQNMEAMDPMPEGSWENFTNATSFNESSVWKYRPDLSTTPETFSPLSKEERDKIGYRRVQHMSVDVGQDGAFEDFWKKVNEMDKNLGISYHMAVFENVFGARNSAYMVVLLDTSRFDYHKNWEGRMTKRQADEAWTSFMESNENMSKWSVNKESNWNQILDLSF